MKAVVFGALLSQGLNAQVLGPAAASPQVANALGGAGPSPPSTATLESPLPAGSSDIILDSQNDAPVNALGAPAPVSTPAYTPGYTPAPVGGTTPTGAGAGLLGGLLNNPLAIPSPAAVLNGAIGNINSGLAGVVGNVNSAGENVASVVAGAVNGIASPVLGAVNNVASPIVSVGALVRTDFGAINLPTVGLPLIATPAPVPAASPAPTSARPALLGLPGAVAGIASNALGLVGGIVNPLFGAPTPYRPATSSPPTNGYPISSRSTSSPVPLYPTNRPSYYPPRNNFEIGLSYEISASGRFGLLAASETLPTDATLTATDTATDVSSATSSATIAKLLLDLGALPTGGIDSLAAGFRPGVWDTEDSTHYDGEDYGDEDLYDGDDYRDGRKPSKGYPNDDHVPCPSYCQKKYPDAGYKGKPTEPGYNSGSKYKPNRPEFPGRSSRSLRSRLEPASGGFAAFNWPSSKGDGGDAEDDDIPDWLYQSAGKSKPRPKCPSSCYKPQKPPAPYKPYDPYAATTQGYPSKPYGTGKPYGPYASGGLPINSTAFESPIWTTETPEPTGTDNSTLPEETPSGEFNLTATITATTLATVVLPYPSGKDSYGSYGDHGSDQSWTGETLAGVCPKTCDPFHPDKNFCDITSSCTTAGGSKHYCACRAGYMASAWNAKDFSKQFHVPGQPYVYVAPGVVCDKVCDDQTCSQVLERPKCV